MALISYSNDADGENFDQSLSLLVCCYVFQPFCEARMGGMVGECSASIFWG
jgi:hypothetical protein